MELKKLLDMKISLQGRDKYALITTLIYAVLTFAIVVNHEPFEDEVNVWMTLHNLGGIQLWKHIFEDGNPFFFFISLFPIVKLGFSYISVQIVCWLSSVAAIFVLNRFSPFPVFLNLLITFSAPMSYCYPVIARCYSMLPILIFLAALFFPYHEENNTKKAVVYLLLLAAITQTHVIMFAFSALMLALFVWQHIDWFRKKKLSVILASSVVLLALFLNVFQSLTALRTNYGYTYPSRITAEHLSKVLGSFFSTFYDISKCHFLYEAPDMGGITFYFPLTITVLIFAVLCFFLFRNSRKLLVIFIASVSFPLYIYLTRHSVIMPYRVFTVHLLFVFFFWVIMKKRKDEMPDKKHLTAALALLFLISIPTGTLFATRDFRENFSQAGDMANFITANIPDDGNSILLAPVPWRSVHIAHLLGNRPVYAMNGEQVRYLDLHPSITERKYYSMPAARKAEYIYIIIPKYQFLIRQLEQMGCVHVYDTPKSLLPEEDYSLYVLYNSEKEST